MVEVLQKSYNMSNNENVDLMETYQKSPNSPSVYDSAKNTDDDVHFNGAYDSDEDAPKNRVKRRIQHFSESDSDREKQQNEMSYSVPQNNTNTPQSSGSEDVQTIFKSNPRNSRFRKYEHDSSSDSSHSGQAMKSSRLSSSSDSDATKMKSTSSKSRILKLSNGNFPETDQAGKNKQQQMRMKNKRDKMKEKFKGLKKSHDRGLLNNVVENEANESISNNSEDSNDEANSIEKIKLKIKEKMCSIPSICDPDTSDEENGEHKFNSKPRKEKRTKLIAPKPQRMSAKQAMENMQKIRSESNRMLREKEVSLPYHRPKALTLKDIMSRRKPALSADGKSLPIKMNEDQLRQYAQMLEERQNEMKELWQSDTDDENDDNEKTVPKNDDDNHRILDDNQPNNITESATLVDEVKSIDDEASRNDTEVTADITPEESDKLFDDLTQSIIEEAKIYNNKETAKNLDIESADYVIEEEDSENNMTLVFDDSKTSIYDRVNVNMANEKITNEGVSGTATIESIVKNTIGDQNNEHDVQESSKNNTEVDSQIISLHFDTENDDTEKLDSEDMLAKICEKELEKPKSDGMEVDAFSDDDLNMADIDNIIENADIIRDIEDKVNSQVLIRDRPLNLKPKLTGGPGMIIDLDDSNIAPKKSGVELLKERFTFFAKLKTPEEIERDKKRRIKPGNQHLKLKQELEEQMAEQRTLEWEKRLEEEKQQQKDRKEIRGDESEDENDIDKIEAKLEEKEAASELPISESEDEEELVEDDIEIKDKPRVKNPMLENEAEESDCDEGPKEDHEENEDDEDEDETDNNNSNDENESSDSESSEEENQPSTKKGRILKAFEDSDDEDTAMVQEKDEEKSFENIELLGTQAVSQDEVLTLAQRQKSVSEDLFTSQESSLQPSQKEIKSTQAVPENLDNDVDLGTQTFSILDSTSNVTAEMLDGSDKLDAIGETQPYNDNVTISGICSGSFSQSLPPLPITQVSQSQAIGEDILAMCTGKFYDNEFESQVSDSNLMPPLGASQEYNSDDNSPVTFDKVLDTNDADMNKDKESVINIVLDTEENNANINKEETVINKLEDESKKTDSSNAQNKIVVDDNLKSILDELDDPEFDTPKPNKFFCGEKTQRADDSEKNNKEEIQIKQKFIIESDDEMNEGGVSEKRKKKLKRKRLEKRALQISDDEEDLSEQEEVEDYESEIEEQNEERLVEYDSEENEIEIKPQTEKQSKKKRKTTEFFEQEAELTSEDEWVGSGDEDEAGLDRMEREEGDDESFHQGRLQRELGQIHMRDVLDQDKREVRIIQELLFEDGDLGGGGRQRKFKWKNLDGEEEAGTGTDEFGETQEEEFESEEQWRKQRHERETFLRQMQNNSEHEDSLNVSINRTTIIKANLMSKTVSMLLEENQPDEPDTPVVPEKKAPLQSPKKPFSLLQQTYQGSILNRGKGALARLAALATPLAVDDDAPKGKSAAPSSGRNFVFAALTPVPKVTKRKADANPSTPKLVKKMKTEEKQSMSKSRLLDHMKM